MSLISDALRKARQEAAERDAHARGVAPPPGPVATRSSSGLGTGLVLGAVIAAVAALSGGVAVWWAVGSGDDPDGLHAAQASAVPAPASGPSTGAGPASDAAEPDPEDDAAEPVAATAADLRLDRTDPGSAPQPDAPDPTPTAATGASTPPPAMPVPRIQPPDPAPGQADPATVAPDGGSGPREFGLVAELGYARLELGYLVYRRDDPFAEVNGREVHVGSRVDGFVVDEITRTSVRLSDHRGAVVLRVR